MGLPAQHMVVFLFPVPLGDAGAVPLRQDMPGSAYTLVPPYPRAKG